MWFDIEYHTGIPIYIQIKDGIKKEIIHRRLKSGESLPSIREFAKTLKVNQNTVAKSFKELEKEGILISIPGIGYKINFDSNKLKESLFSSLNPSLKKLLQKYKKLGISKKEISELFENLWEEI
jgi:GntR family transcriptional regulator